MSINRFEELLRIFVVAVVFSVITTATVVLAQDSAPWWTQEIKSKLPQCRGEDFKQWHNCFGIHKKNSSVYQGEWKNGNWSGKGAHTTLCMNYIGEYKEGNRHGQGIHTDSGLVTEGIWENDKFIREEKTIFPRLPVSKISIDSFKEIEDFKINPTKLPICPEPDDSKTKFYGKDGKTHDWNNCWGKIAFQLGDDKHTIEGKWKKGHIDGIAKSTWNGKLNYIGEYKNDRRHGKGTIYHDTSKFVGEWKNDHPYGKGVTYHYAGCKIEGIYDISLKEFNLHLPIVFSSENHQKMGIEQEKARKKSEELWNLGQQRRENKSKGIALQITNTEPDASGAFTIKIQTNVDTASLKIDGQEQGGRADGTYSIKKVARAGQETQFSIVAVDVDGNTDTKIIRVNRAIIESSPLFASLNPSQLKKQPERDAVAIIIGIADYKNLPRADFANDDASVFYDYAVRALGIRPENIKLLVDANADAVAIYQAFKTWLPSRVRSTTDVYVYYSGHGLPSEDGQGLYLLPQRAHRDLIEKTAISQREINGFIQAARPLSVTIFLDSCYSGLARTGETLLASARPAILKADKKLFPDEFTVITASQADQISSSSPDLKHGIFSYYLMRGMEGEADANRDGKITAGEMHGYLAEQVARQAGMMNRRQEPQLVGDANRILVGK